MPQTAFSSTLRQSTPLLGAVKGPLRLRVRGGRRNGEVLSLTSSKCTIGRSEVCTVSIDDPAASDLHCLLLRGESATIVRNLCQQTQLNGKPFSEASLQVGDVLTCGQTSLEVLPGEEETPENHEDDLEETFEAARRRWKEWREELERQLQEARDDLRRQEEASVERERLLSLLMQSLETFHDQTLLARRQRDEWVLQRDEWAKERTEFDELRQRQLEQLEMERRDIQLRRDQLESLVAELERGADFASPNYGEPQEHPSDRQEQPSDRQEQSSDRQEQPSDLSPQPESCDIASSPAETEPEVEACRGANGHDPSPPADVDVEAPPEDGPTCTMTLKELSVCQTPDSLEETPGAFEEIQPFQQGSFDASDKNAPLSTTELLARLGHQVNGEDDSPETSEQRPVAPPSATEAPSSVESAACDQDDDDDSIESYMKRLLQRVGADEAAVSVQPQPSVEPVETPEIPVEEPDEELAEPSIQFASPLVGRAALDTPTRETPINETPQQPRTPAARQAPLDLHAMRALANSSARLAIHHSETRRQYMMMVTKVLVTAICVLGGLLLFRLAHGNLFYYACGLISLGTGVFWGRNTKSEWDRWQDLKKSATDDLSTN